jgi:hypothetical protein
MVFVVLVIALMKVMTILKMDCVNRVFYMIRENVMKMIILIFFGVIITLLILGKLMNKKNNDKEKN